jgi:hypothetical protein
MQKKMPRQYAIFLILVSVSGLVFATLTTLPFGAGVSSDAVRTLSTADNLLKGKGFFDYSGEPFLWWPPLYPITLAFFAKITGGDLFTIAWVLNIVLHGFNIWLAGKWLYLVFQERIVWAYLGAIIVVTSLSIYKVAVSIGPDVPFITLSLAFLITLGSWDGSSLKVIVFLGILAAIATSHRLLAIVLPATGSIYILAKSNLKRKFVIAGIFSIASCLPLTTWLVLHNYLQYDTFFGPRNYEDMLPWRNLTSFLEKILNWFFPYFSLQNKFPFVNFWILAILLIVFIATYYKKNWAFPKNKCSNPAILPSILFSLLYLATLIFTVDYFEHKYQSDDRFLVVILVPITGLLFHAIDKLILTRVQANDKQISLFLIILFGAWSIYPFYLLHENVSLTYSTHGVVYNNVYNTTTYRNSKTIQMANRLIEKSDVPITFYSNNPAAFWLFTRHDVKLLPVKNTKTNQAVVSELFDTSTSSKVYIVWFIPDIFEITITPKKLSKVMDLETVFTSTDGEIYYVNTK